MHNIRQKLRWVSSLLQITADSIDKIVNYVNKIGCVHAMRLRGHLSSGRSAPKVTFHKSSKWRGAAIKGVQ
jgi:hypothetical protein